MASHDPCASLAALPTEVIQMVLFQIACPEDLSAAIRASPLIFQSFLGQREHILIRVIQSSLDPEIFMEVLGFLHLPNLSNLHLVIGPPEVRRHISTMDLWYEYWHLRWRAQNKFAWEFLREHFGRIDEGRKPGAPQPFPIPTIKRPVDQEQVAEFRRAVNTVVGIFGSLGRHMERTSHKTTIAFFRDVWDPAIPYPITFVPFLTTLQATTSTPYVYLGKWNPVLDEQRRFLRELFEEKMKESR